MFSFTYFHTNRPFYTNIYLFHGCQGSTNLNQASANFLKQSPFSGLFWSGLSHSYKLQWILHNFFLLLQKSNNQSQIWGMKLNFSIPDSVPPLAKVGCSKTCRPVLYDPHFRKERLYPSFVEVSENFLHRRVLSYLRLTQYFNKNGCNLIFS